MAQVKIERIPNEVCLMLHLTLTRTNTQNLFQSAHLLGGEAH
jgi:hypothetical protein